MFLFYMAAGLLITGALFWWAVVKGQFTQQNRARYLALEGIEPIPKTDLEKTAWPKEIVITVIVAFSGLALLVTFALVIALD